MAGDRWSRTDGTVTIRPPRPGDAATLVAGRDAEFERWMGPGDPDPEPTACIEVDREVVGWVDFDEGRPWLEGGEVNIGYHVFTPRTGRGIGTRAVSLFLQHLAEQTEIDRATVLIDPANERSARLATRLGFVDRGRVGDQILLTRPVRTGSEAVDRPR